jgi:hypothetical protein
MPDPLLYLQSASAAAICSVILVLTIRRAQPKTEPAYLRIAGVAGFGLGAVAGYGVLGLPVPWPPDSALDRLLTIVLPAALIIEAAACAPWMPAWLVLLLRCTLIASGGRILLHGSVYLSGADGAWTPWQSALVLAASAVLLAVVWILISRLFERCPDVSIPLAIVMATASAGALIMLAGYLAGGAAAIPLAATLLGTTAASHRANRGGDLRGALALGIVGLFGLLFIGRFFGRLSALTAAVVFLTPLSCWVVEFPGLRSRRPWQNSVLRLVLVAAVLSAVLAIAKVRFDRDMRPLLPVTCAELRLHVNSADRRILASVERNKHDTSTSSRAVLRPGHLPGMPRLAWRRSGGPGA